MVPRYRIEGSGPAFVYVCGIEGTGELFYKQASDLARDHTVITFPLRGRGRYQMSELVGDLAHIVRDAGFERATFLGESFGGLLTMATALEHSELFERMILLNTFPFFVQRAKIGLGVLCFSLLPYPFMKAHRTRTARHVLFSADVSEEDRQQFRTRTSIVEHEGYVSRMRIIRDTDLRPRLKEIEVPALVVAGTADRLLDSVRAARVLVEGLPRARLKLLEGTGHVALLSERVRVSDWLGEFDKF
jgi:pimeloyl-ACP methyl ester carboxylesterase